MDFDGGDLQRSNLSYILRNPVYSQADLDIYEFFKAQGADVVNDAADFSGTNGCYLFKGRDVTERKSANLKDHLLVLAPHEGLVSSETWLACRKKLVGNTSFGSTHKAKNTWLAGKVKCGVCGSGLMYAPSANRSGYFRCRKRADSKSCPGPGTIRVLSVEDFVYDLMCQKMAEFQTLTGGNPMKQSPKQTALNVELLQVEAEIEKLLDTLTGASATLLSYANTKIEELDARRQGIMKAIADMSAEAVSPEHMKRISNHLYDWDNADFEDRRLVADGLVAKIVANNESIQIAWKI